MDQNQIRVAPETTVFIKLKGDDNFASKQQIPHVKKKGVTNGR